MKLIERIRADRITAFKAKENIKKNLLGCLISDACKDPKEGKEPSDSFVLSIIKKFIDNAKFVMEKCDPKEYEFYQASMEIDILETYRPEQFDASTIELIFSLNNFANINKAMGYFKENYPGQYDGKLVSDIFKKVL